MNAPIGKFQSTVKDFKTIQFVANAPEFRKQLEKDGEILMCCDDSPSFLDWFIVGVKTIKTAEALGFSLASIEEHRKYPFQAKLTFKKI